jgi:catechol 2,3-dioxygenase-like lactoylglutathione lyase family enzyme
MDVMRLRLELFVHDLDASIAFYTEVLGFVVVRRDERYVSIRRGHAVIGLGPIGGLPERGDGPAFTQARLADDRGAGVEVVFEVDDVNDLIELYEHCRARVTIAGDLRMQPWGLQDFRLVDPDGYYLRITHGNEAPPGTPADGGVSR